MVGRNRIIINLDLFYISSQNKVLDSSSHSLHFYKKCDKNFIPIVYNKDYDIYFFKLENIHPFDTKKWGKIAKLLEEYFENVLNIFECFNKIIKIKYVLFNRIFKELKMKNIMYLRPI